MLVFYPKRMRIVRYVVRRILLDLQRNKIVEAVLGFAKVVDETHSVKW